MIFLRRPPDRTPPGLPALRPGLPDELFVHGEGLITKSEIRAVALSKLRLPETGVLWDLGAGSGAVAIEAAGLMPAGKVFAVEKNADRLAHIRANQARFAVSNLTTCPGVLPGVMDDLPDPDRIFIGGGGGDLAAIMDKGAVRLRPGGIMVVNAVLLTSLSQCLAAFQGLGFETDIIQIQIHRGQTMPHGHRLQGGNPVWIIQGVKHD